MPNQSIKTLHSDHLRPFIASVQALGIITEDESEEGEILYPPLRGECSQDDISKFDKLNLNYLSADQQIKLRRLLMKHPKLFSDIPGKTKVVYHTIPLVEGAKPRAYKPYRIPDRFKAEINKQIDDLLEQGRIVRSNSLYLSLIHI